MFRPVATEIQVPDPETPLRTPIVLRLSRWIAIATGLCLAAAPLHAQGEVRFVLVITGGIPPYLRGELRLSRQGQQWQGTLSIEDNDSLFIVTGLRDPGDSLCFDAPLLGGMHFAGAQHGNGFVGESRASDGVIRNWSADRLSAGREYYPSLPRFTLRQIVLDGTITPGPLPPLLLPLLAPAASIDSLYRLRARLGGWEALTGKSLPQDRGPRALGVLNRSVTIDAERATLMAIERGITDPAVHRRFVALFHPAGNWIVDLHDAALRSASIAQPTFELGLVRPALQAMGEPGADTASTEHLLTAVYRLLQLGTTDSAAFVALLQNAGPGIDPSRKALLTLLDGYQSALGWHAAALTFLLTDSWLPAGLPGHSVADLVRGLGIGFADAAPAIRPRLLGYVQAFPHVRLPDNWIDSLVRAENPNAHEWLIRHGRSDLLLVLHHLPAAVDTGAVIAEAGTEYRLSTVGREARMREAGFLEPADEIVTEAGLSPLLSVQTAVHEWIHILHEHAREKTGRAWRMSPSGSAHYQPVTPVLAEGFAEWEAERAMAPLLTTFPLLGIFETEKRSAMAAESPDDPHLVGYRLVGGVAGRLGEPGVIRLFVQRATDPDELARAPELKLARPPSARSRGGSSVIAARSVLPETRFTVDDTYPQVIGVRIVVPIQ